MTSPAPWSAGCFAVVRPLLEPVASPTHLPTFDQLERWLVDRNVRSAAGEPMHVVANPPRRRKKQVFAETYEALVYAGKIPTRTGSWHDVFNVAAFATFPLSKARLAERHVRALVARQAQGPGIPAGVRCRERDTLALLDEGGVLLAVAPENSLRCQQALEDHDLSELATLHRHQFVRPWVFGHALLEHATRTALGENLGPSPRALTIPVTVASPLLNSLEAIDSAFADWLAAMPPLEPPGYPGIALQQWYSDTPPVADAGAGRC